MPEEKQIPTIVMAGYGQHGSHWVNTVGHSIDDVPVCGILLCLVTSQWKWLEVRLISNLAPVIHAA